MQIWKFDQAQWLPPVLVAAIVSVLGVGCDEEASVTITEPARGAMLPAGQEVTVEVETDADEVVIDGQSLTGTGRISTTVPEVDGLGFVVAEIPGDPLIAVRSYHQGELRPAHSAHSGTLVMRLGPAAVDGDAEPTLADMIGWLLAGAELEAYVDDPITVTAVGVQVDVEVRSVLSPRVEVSLPLSAAEGLRIHATLEDTLVTYTASENVPLVDYSHDGTALFETIELDGALELGVEGATLVETEVTFSDPEFSSAGSVDGAVIDALAPRFVADLEPAVIEAADQAADAVLAHLLAQLRPEVNAAFEQPLRQQIDAESIEVVDGAIELRYQSLIEAEAPMVATADHGVLARPGPAGAAAGDGLAADLGPALINQLVFALWDGGNLEGIGFSQEELEALGMRELEFPYTQLDEVAISLLLPPLLAWADDGPRLEVGGVEVDITVSGAEDMTAWTAASVPVQLSWDAASLRVEPDPDRDVRVREVGFDHLSTLADPVEVNAILQTAVPGVVEAALGQVPAIVLPRLDLPRLDGSDGLEVIPALDGLERGEDGWRLLLTISTEE